MRLRIKQLKLENFKGIKEKTIDFNGHDRSNIIGANASGKSTCYDGFLWLLFEKDSRGAKDFGIKTLDGKGDAIPMLDHSVTGILEIDGVKTTLKKTYKEIWTRKRGAAKAAFTGHETTCSIDGVPKTKGEYQTHIAGIAPENLFRLLTNPMYFNVDLHWRDRRKALLDIFGDIQAADILAANPELEPIAGLFAKYAPDDAKKVVMAQRKEINDELITIPARIDEATRSMPDVDGIVGRAALDARKTIALDAIKETRERRTEAMTGTATVALQNDIGRLQGELIQIANLHNSSQPDTSEEIKLATELQKKVHDLEMNRELTRNHLDGRKILEETMVANINKMLENFRALAAKKYDGGDHCPTCGQSIQPEKLKEAVEAFNLDKAEKLAEIENSGKQMKDAVLKIREAIKASNEKIALLDKEIIQTSTALDEAREAVNRKATNRPDVKSLPEYKEIEQQIAHLSGQLTLAKEGVNGALGLFDDKIRKAETEVDEVNQLLAALEASANQRKRITELNEREKELARMFEDCERDLNLIEQFIRIKVRMLTEAINGRFELVRWKLFDEQVNGGVAESCVCMINGVPFSDMNSAARIQAGLDIIKTMSRHENFSPCIWIDNRESVTDVPEMDCQLISLIVTPDANLSVQ